jgi:hypothetical protein
MAVCVWSWENVLKPGTFSRVERGEWNESSGLCTDSQEYYSFYNISLLFLCFSYRLSILGAF